MAVINSRKILTISATEYCKMVGKALKDFEPIGIQTQSARKNIEDFVNEVPRNAEVVVNYRVNLVSLRFRKKDLFKSEQIDTLLSSDRDLGMDASIYQVGTALIPRYKK